MVRPADKQCDCHREVTVLSDEFLAQERPGLNIQGGYDHYGWRLPFGRSPASHVRRLPVCSGEGCEAARVLLAAILANERSSRRISTISIPRAATRDHGNPRYDNNHSEL